ncbi:MAG TPA: hypothetical protein VFT99_08935, partial [Roseiflexaceae bacterium]|nr:hypothetical protein [Roseiflexaceae bacterium]
MPTCSSQPRPRFERLGERTRMMLQRLNDCVLVAEDDLCAMIWPEAVTRQARQERFARWFADGYLQHVDVEDHTCYQ